LSFQYGCLVFWGLDAEEQQFFMSFIEDFEEAAVEEEEEERDDMTFYYAPRFTAYVSIRQHASACVSMRQHTSAYVRPRVPAACLNTESVLSVVPAL